MLDSVEQAIVDGVSRREMWEHLEYLCRLDRTSGTPGEHEAMDYIASVLRGYGVTVDVHTFDAYLSYPREARIEVLSASHDRDRARHVRAKTRSFSASTPPEGLDAALVYVPGGRDIFRDTESHRRLAEVDISGRIVISEAGSRTNMLTAMERGAVGYIHVWPSEENQIHEGIVTPIWGTPTPERLHMLPRIPIVSVTRGDGQALIGAARDGQVRIRLLARSETGSHGVKLPVATIAGREPAFVLLSGHVDSWHLGATDNATGNVTMMEVVRLFQQHRSLLRRGLRVAFWPGHSTGRYAGSTWYADHFWDDLHAHCVAHLNCDSTGSAGATDYTEIMASAEAAPLGVEVVRELSGQEAAWEHPVRAGDQSFWGVGVPSLFMLLSQRPKEQRAAVGGSGGGWWWHTEEDTIDKVDANVLLLDTRIYALACLRLCRAAWLPLSVTARASDLSQIVGGLRRRAPGRFDLEGLAAEVERFQQAAERLEAVKARSRANGADDVAAVFSRAAHHALRMLVPVVHTQTGPFDHDPAVPTLPLPGLQPVARLAELDPGSDEFRFLTAKLLRERNRTIHALREASRVLEDALSTVEA